MLLVWKDSIQVSCLFCCIAFCILPVEQTWQVKKSMRRCWWSSPGWCTQLFVSQLELTDVTHVWRCMSFLLDVFYSSLFCLHDFVVLPRNGLRNAGVIPFALTVCSDENDETFVVCSRLKHHWSAYLSFLESLRKTFLTLCPMAAMFFALVVVFLVKHAYGMRGPTQAELMEAERRKCAQRGAGRVDMPYAFGECICPSDRPRVTKECGFTRSNFFRLSDAKPGCRCVTKAEAQELRKMPVAASALRFCDALVDQSKRAAELRPWQDRMSRQDLVSRVMRNITEDTLKKTSPEICQHALTGTISKTEAEKAPWAEKASELSRKGSVQDQDGDRAYGRMRAVKESATTPAEKALWEHALAQVCKDECTDLLNMMKEEARNLANDVEWKHVPFAQTCAERVGTACRSRSAWMLCTLLRVWRPQVLAVAFFLPKRESGVELGMLCRDECVEELVTRVNVQLGPPGPLGQKGIQLWPGGTKWDRCGQGAPWSEFLVGLDKGRSSRISTWQRSKSPWRREGEHGVLAGTQGCWWGVPPSWVLQGETTQQDSQWVDFAGAGELPRWHVQLWQVPAPMVHRNSWPLLSRNATRHGVWLKSLKTLKKPTFMTSLRIQKKAMQSSWFTKLCNTRRVRTIGR